MKRKNLPVADNDTFLIMVFVPSIPTPLAGAVYILDRKRVHPLSVPFTEALKTVSKWGSGAKDLVAAMEREVNSSK